MTEIQTEQPQPINSPPPKKVNRRSFLTALGVSTIGGALAGTSIAAAVENKKETLDQTNTAPETTPSENVLTPEQKLEKAGLTEFIPVYLQSKLFFEKWGVYPPVFPEIRKLLFKIVSDDPEAKQSDLYANLKESWGSQIKEDDEKVLPDATIEFSSDVDQETQEHIEKVFRKTLHAFPALGKVTIPRRQYGGDVALVCGYDAEKQPVLGCTDNETFTHLGNQTDENFAWTLVHESNHNLLDKFGNDPEVFQYLSKRHTSDYAAGTIFLIDQFLTDVAQDTSTSPSEFTYGYSNWKDRTEVRNNLTLYKQLLSPGEEQIAQPTTINYTGLSEDPEYNRTLRAVLKATLTDQINNATPEDTDLIRKMIKAESKFIYHILHNIQFEEPVLVGKNRNAIVQRFMDLGQAHQRLWLPFASGGKISNTISINELRYLCGLPSLQSEGEDKPQKSWVFDYPEYGCTPLLESESEFIRVNLTSLPECPTDRFNNYFSLDISSVLHSKARPNTLLVAIPRSTTIAECTVQNNEQITLLLSDNSKLTIHTGVNLDTTSPNYGSIAFQERNIESDNTSLSYMSVQTTKLSAPSVSHVQSQIGAVGSLNEQKRTKIHNVPAISIVDIDNNLSAYTANADIQLTPGDTIRFEDKDSDGAAIIKTSEGPRLLINALPPKIKYDNVSDLIADIQQYGAIIIGETLLSDFDPDPDSLRMDYQLHSSKKDVPGIVSATVIAEKNDDIRVFPLFIKIN